MTNTDILLYGNNPPQDYRTFSLSKLGKANNSTYIVGIVYDLVDPKYHEFIFDTGKTKANFRGNYKWSKITNNAKLYAVGFFGGSVALSSSAMMTLGVAAMSVSFSSSYMISYINGLGAKSSTPEKLYPILMGNMEAVMSDPKIPLEDFNNLFLAHQIIRCIWQGKPFVTNNKMLVSSPYAKTVSKKHLAAAMMDKHNHVTVTNTEYDRLMRVREALGSRGTQRQVEGNSFIKSPPLNGDVDVSVFVEKFQKVTDEWNAYDLSITEILRIPLINDFRNPMVKEFRTKYSYTDSAKPKEGVYLPMAEAESFKGLVSSLHVLWDSLRSEAELQKTKIYTNEQQQNISKANSLMQVALGDSHSLSERQSAYLQATKLLDGILVIPPKAIQEVSKNHRPEISS